MEYKKKKFEPGDMAKVTGNRNLIGGIYHTFNLGLPVKIMYKRYDYNGDIDVNAAYKCIDELGNIQTVLEADLEPLTP